MVLLPVCVHPDAAGSAGLKRGVLWHRGVVPNIAGGVKSCELTRDQECPNFVHYHELLCVIDYLPIVGVVVKLDAIDTSMAVGTIYKGCFLSINIEFKAGVGSGGDYTWSKMWIGTGQIVRIVLAKSKGKRGAVSVIEIVAALIVIGKNF